MARRNSFPALRVFLLLAALGIIAAGAAYVLLPEADMTELRDSARNAVGGGDNRLVASENGDDAPAPQQAALPGGDGAALSRIEVVEGQTTVRLDADGQARSGLKTQVLEKVEFTPEIAALGRVVDLQPLLAQRARFSSALAQANVVRASLEVAKADYERLASLSLEEGDIARKRLLHADAEVKRSAAELARYESEMRAVREETRQQWGPVLSAWALAGPSPEFERLLNREDALLLVTLPPGMSLAPGAATVRVARDGARGDAVPATFLSPAPATDPMLQGETYFFCTSAQGLRAGMRVDVWANQSQEPEAGVIVPQDAVVWALGQAWAYVQVDDAHFARRPIATGIRAPGGWFVMDSVRAGDSIVVAGAQILYAEEFRWQIRDEDKD